MTVSLLCAGDPCSERSRYAFIFKYINPKEFSILCKHKQMQVHHFDNRVHNSYHQSQYIEAGVIIHYRIHTYNISTETIFSCKMIINILFSQ